MEKAMAPADFLTLSAERPVLDVRAPGEYAQGHIPGALSFPLFSDEERARVGTTYKQVGKEAAMELGLRIVGPKMEGFVKSAKKIAPERKLALHCWRGGQRSGSMAWLFRQCGFEVATLHGGYKAYRQYILEQFGHFTLKIIVVGGKTGSGKTKILQALRELGEQVVDLEGLAHHKGSAFGFIGEAPQPTVEQFENELFATLQQQSPQKRVWLENESQSIGRVYIPKVFWEKMKAAPLFNVNIPDDARIRNLLADYVLSDRDALVLAFEKIASRLGGLNYKNALESLQAGDFASAAQIALMYYDKTYQHCLDVNISPDIRHFEFPNGDPAAIARQLAAVPLFQ